MSARGRRRTGLLLVLAVAAPACRDARPPAPSRVQFVDAYVGLVRARIDANGDSASYAAKRKRVLLDAGLTAEDLRAFVEAGREEPAELSATWQAIVARLDTLYGGVTSQAPPALRRRLRGAANSTPPSPLADSIPIPTPPAPR